MNPPTDERLAEWEKLFGSAREGDDDTILNLCAIGWKLIQEVRRLRVERVLVHPTDATAQEIFDAHQRAEKAEAERDHLRVELESLKQNITSQYRQTGLR